MARPNKPGYFAERKCWRFTLGGKARYICKGVPHDERPQREGISRRVWDEMDRIIREAEAAPVTVSTSDLTLFWLTQMFLDWTESEVAEGRLEKSKYTNCRLHMGIILDHFSDKHVLARLVTPEIADEFFERFGRTILPRTEELPAPYNVHEVGRSLRALFRWAARPVKGRPPSRLIPANPLEGYKFPPQPGAARGDVEGGGRPAVPTLGLSAGPLGRGAPPDQSSSRPTGDPPDRPDHRSPLHQGARDGRLDDGPVAGPPAAVRPDLCPDAPLPAPDRVSARRGVRPPVGRDRAPMPCSAPWGADPSLRADLDPGRRRAPEDPQADDPQARDPPHRARRSTPLGARTPAPPKRRVRPPAHARHGRDRAWSRRSARRRTDPSGKAASGKVCKWRREAVAEGIAGIQDVGPTKLVAYASRHAFASEGSSLGFSDAQIARQMGDTPEVMRKVYAHKVAAETARKIVRRRRELGQAKRADRKGAEGGEGKEAG